MSSSNVLRRSKKPEISIFIFLHNDEKNIDQCLTTLLNQSFSNYEVICIEEKTEDHTSAIIQKYVNSDSRISFICGSGGEAGEMLKNKALSQAEGEYCLFVRGSDFFEMDLLKKSLDKIKNDRADVCLFGGGLYYDGDIYCRDAVKFLCSKELPETIPFDGKDLQHIFHITNSYLGNKLIKRKLLEENNILFTPYSGGSDVYFTYLTVLLAERITVLPQIYVKHRQTIPMEETAFYNGSWCLYEELKLLYKKLLEYDLYSQMEDRFKNLVFQLSMEYLASLDDASVFLKVYDILHNMFFAEFGLENLEKEVLYTYNRRFYSTYQNIQRLDAREFLFQEIKKLKKAKTDWISAAETENAELEKVKECVTYRTGKKVLDFFKKN